MPLLLYLLRAKFTPRGWELVAMVRSSKMKTLFLVLLAIQTATLVTKSTN